MRLLTIIFLVGLATQTLFAADTFTLTKDHPRILINSETLKELAKNCKGPLAKEYAELKSNADQAVKSGQIKYIDNKWATPTDLLACGMTYLVERENGNPQAAKYAEPVIKCWGNGSRISNKDGSAFGYHALAYDWIFDALSPEQQKLYGNALGTWLTWYTNKPEITLNGGHWEYNQTWGVSHMNVMHARDAIVQKLFISLTIAGAGTDHESKAVQFLNSWNERIPRDCIPAFDAMGGSWAESHGHGSYGPISVVPWSFEAWHTATGKNWFELGAPDSFLKEMSRWLTYLSVPHNGRHAYIDDGGGSKYSSFQASAPIIAKVLNDPLAQFVSDTAAAEDSYKWGSVWQRLLSNPSIKAQNPAELKLPLGYLLKGAGHVFMRSEWENPNATWAFFGAGRHAAGHQHDDEGHFMITRQGGLVSKGGGTGEGNDSDHYWGGSIAFNILTIFDPSETFNRNSKNENDGGLIRLVYNNGKVERGHIAAFEHNDNYTYAAADLSKAYNSNKAKEVSRQFVYLRNEKKGGDEYFVVFDRLQSTKADFAKHFILHMPEEPTVSGTATEKVPGHVTDYAGEGLISSWVSMPNDSGKDVEALSSGKSRLFLKTLLPEQSNITKRGGDGHKNWGHPLEASAQYDHHNAGRDKGPVSKWRLEVATPLAERSYFLHVFQVTAEGTSKMVEVELIEKSGQVGARIGKDWEITFTKTGALSGSIKLPNGKTQSLTNSVDTADQYQQWDDARSGKKSVKFNGKDDEEKADAQKLSKTSKVKESDDDSLRASYTDYLTRLQAELNVQLKAEKIVYFTYQMLRKEIQITKQSERGYAIRSGSSDMTIDIFRKMSDTDAASLSSGLAKNGGDEANALAAYFHALHQGKSAALPFLSKAGNQADAVRQLLNQ